MWSWHLHCHLHNYVCMCCHTPLLWLARICLVIPFEAQWFKANLPFLREFLFSTVTNISLAFICIRASNCAIFSIFILLVIYHLASRGAHYAKDKEKPVTSFLKSICLILYSMKMEIRIEFLFIICIDCKILS